MCVFSLIQANVLFCCYDYDYGRYFAGLHLYDVSINKKEALKFLFASRRSKRLRQRRSTTNIVVECCDEGCVVEEISEYC